MKSVYQEGQRERAIQLLNDRNPVFYGGTGGRYFMQAKREFVLTDFSKNFFEPIKNEVIEYFSENRISWWGGINPTGHVLSSQIACLNHLFSLRKDKNAVMGILKTISTDFIDVMEIKTDKHFSGFIQFEAVSDNDYLNEGKSTRGSNCTSVDALIYAQHKDGSNWLIPVEWKYTEFYENLDKAKEGCKNNPENCKGKERQEIYTELINNSKQLKGDNHYCYYFEPFYQLMRQTLWAEQMIVNRDRETIKADSFLHVHVIPSQNADLLKKQYKCSGKEMETTWKDHLKNKEKYVIISPKSLLDNLDTVKYKDLISYLSIRYWNEP